VTPSYYVFDCIRAAGPAGAGRLQVIDFHGGVGSGLTHLAEAYGGRAAAAARLRPYLARLGQLAAGRRILFVHDTFSGGQPFPDDFFNLVQRYIAWGPITDWVPDLQSQQPKGAPRAPDIEEMGIFLDPLAARLRLKIGYCTAARIEHRRTAPARGKPRPDGPSALLSGYRDRARRRPNSEILPLQEIGVVVFSGPSDRFPDDFRRQPGLAPVNPPLLDQLLETKWLPRLLLEGTPAADLLPPTVPVGMGMQTAAEVMDFAGELQTPDGGPLAVLKPANARLSPGVRFLDRTALRALAARQPERRLPRELAEALLAPRVMHTYEEISQYRGKLLDNLLRTPGAEVHDQGDGTFTFSAAYPFLATTVALLQEYVEAQPVRSRRTGKLHRGSLKVVMFDGQVVSAVHRLDQEPDEGTFRDPTRPDTPVFYEAAAPEEEARLREELQPLAVALDRGFAERACTDEGLAELQRRWAALQTNRAEG
jgi:hypothetical protein